jgi:hypothetical protein
MGDTSETPTFTNVGVSLYHVLEEPSEPQTEAEPAPPLPEGPVTPAAPAALTLFNTPISRVSPPKPSYRQRAKREEQPAKPQLALF